MTYIAKLVRIPSLFKDFKEWMDGKVNQETQKLTRQMLILNSLVKITPKELKEESKNITERRIKKITESAVLENTSSYASVLNVTEVKRTDVMNENITVKECQVSRKLVFKQKKSKRKSQSRKRNRSYDANLVLTLEEG